MTVIRCSATLLLAVSLTVSAAELSPTASPDRTVVLSAARSVMTGAHFTTFITVGENGQPQARVLDPSDPDTDFTVWLGTNLLSRKVAQLQHNPAATLSYFDRSTLSYVTLLGSATLVSDQGAKDKHWQSSWAPFFPQGSKSPNFALLRFTPKSLEIVSLSHKLYNDPQTSRPVIVTLP
jgi:general stress protein 26